MSEQTCDPIAAELDELNRHLGPDAIERAGLRAAMTDEGAVFETAAGAVYLLRRGAAWRLAAVRDGDELACWRNGRELGRQVLPRSWRPA